MSARVVFVTGHEFGMAALHGMTASAAFAYGRISIPLLVTLDTSAADSTVGFAAGRVPEMFCGDVVATRDGRLADVLPLMSDAAPAFVCVIGWSYLVRSMVLDLPREVVGAAERQSSAHGCIGMHPSLLPYGRGRAPLPWAILHGCDQTGLTVFRLEEAADAGGIIWQEAIPLSPRETATSLFARVRTMHRVAGEALAEKMGAGAVTAEPQDESRAVVWAKRTPADSEITSAMTVIEVDRLVRAQAEPYPSAFLSVDGRQFEVAASVARTLGDPSDKKGVTVIAEDWIDFGVVDGVVRLLGHWQAS